jgi:anti-sigma-K factor RskA
MEAGIHQLTAGYALDALDPDERRAYEAHLAECASCRAELSSFWRTSEALAVAASGPEPSPDLRDRIVSAARAEPRVVVPFESPRRRRLAPALGAVATVAAVVAVAVGLWAVQLSSDLDDTRSALERERAAAAVLADPGARTVSLAEGQGRLVVAEDGRAALVLDGLDPAPNGKTYALWIIEDGTPAPAGLFPGSEGLELVKLDGVVDNGDVVAVTVEDGPVTGPTTTPIVASDPV